MTSIRYLRLLYIPVGIQYWDSRIDFCSSKFMKIQSHSF